MGAEAFLRRGAVFFCSGICISVFCGLMVFEVIDKPGEKQSLLDRGEDDRCKVTVFSSQSGGRIRKCCGKTAEKRVGEGTHGNTQKEKPSKAKTCYGRLGRDNGTRTHDLCNVTAAL